MAINSEVLKKVLNQYDHWNPEQKKQFIFSLEEFFRGEINYMEFINKLSQSMIIPVARQKINLRSPSDYSKHPEDYINSDYDLRNLLINTIPGIIQSANIKKTDE